MAALQAQASAVGLIIIDSVATLAPKAEIESEIGDSQMRLQARMMSQASRKHKRQTLSQEEMIRRYVSHIPARHFKMIRYYGFLTNRKRGHLLPKVYDALDMMSPNIPEKPGVAALIKGFLNTDPYQCLLCGNRLRFMRHAVTLLSERRDKMAKKRWLQTTA